MMIFQNNTNKLKPSISSINLKKNQLKQKVYDDIAQGYQEKEAKHAKKKADKKEKEEAEYAQKVEEYSKQFEEPAATEQPVAMEELAPKSKSRRIS